MKYSIKRTELIEADSLTRFKRRLFFDKLFTLTKQIFGGVTKDDFERMVSQNEAEASKFLIYKNAKDEWVGYLAIHRFLKKVDQQEVCIFRSQLGLIPEYRRKNARFFFAVSEILKYKIKHLSQEVYYFVSIINPSMYSITNKMATEVYPSPGRTVPDHIKHIIEKCSYYFDFPKKEGDSFWARSSHWYPLHSKKEIEYWNNSKDKYVTYYTLLNPEFLTGRGLLTLVSANSKSGLFSLFKAFFYTCKKNLRHFSASMF